MPYLVRFSHWVNAWSLEVLKLCHIWRSREGNGHQYLLLFWHSDCIWREFLEEPFYCLKPLFSTNGFLISYYIIVGCIHTFLLILIVLSAWVRIAHSCLIYEHPLHGAYFLFPNVNANMWACPIGEPRSFHFVTYVTTHPFTSCIWLMASYPHCRLLF